MTLPDVNLVRIKRISEDATFPTQATPGSTGYDLYAIKDGIVAAHSTALLPTGLTISVSEGAYGIDIQIRARSSMALKGLIIPNAPATIDVDYRGELGVMLHNLTDTDYYYKKGDRIAQLLVGRVVVTGITEGEFTDSERKGGAMRYGGLGSTGV